MKVLGYIELYELIKCCAHDLDAETRKKRSPILDKVALNFEDYCIRFYYRKYDFTSLIEVIIYSYIEPAIDDIDGNQFLAEHEFFIRFKNVDKNKTPQECDSINKRIKNFFLTLSKTEINSKFVMTSIR